jgi:class 3 adenylate cyclase
LFMGGGGIASLAAAGLFAVHPRPGWNATLLALLVMGAIAGSLALFIAAPHVSLAAMQLITVAAAVYIGFGQVVAAKGGNSQGTLMLLWPVLWAFTYLPPRKAGRIAAHAQAILAVIFIVQPGWEDPVVQWVFLACTFLVTAATMTVLVRRAESANVALQSLNANLEHRVQDQVGEVERLARLRRFLSPQVADAVMEGDASLAFHRREIAVVFIDLRGFTAFSAVAEPEDVTDVLAEYHAAIGALVDEHEATVGTFAGDGVMLYFNDPLPCDDPAGLAIDLALGLAPRMAPITERWERRGFDIGYGVGIALGYATIGMMGFDSRSDYTALGSVVNLASRLCDEAGRGEILLDRRTKLAVEGRVETQLAGDRRLKGFPEPVVTYRVIAGASQASPATMRVV